MTTPPEDVTHAEPRRRGLATWVGVPLRLVARIRSRKFFANVLVLASGAAAGQALIVLASPLLTRLYTPDDFGVLAVFSSILSILIVISCLRYELGIPLPEQDGVAANLLVLSLGVVGVMTCATGVGTHLLGDALAGWTKVPGVRPYLWVLSLGLAGAGVYQALNYWAIRREAFGRIAQTKFNQGLSLVVTQVGLGLLKTGPVGLIVGFVVGQFAGSGTLGLRAWRQDAPLLKQASWKGVLEAANRYRRFPLISGVSGVVNSAGLNLPSLLIAGHYGPHVAGLFALGQRVVGSGARLVGQSIGQVYLARVSRLAQDDPAALPGHFVAFVRRLLALGVLPFGVLCSVGPWLFSVVFGPKWHEAGVYMQMLAPALLMQFAVSPLSQVILVMERQDLQLWWDLARVAGTTLSFVVPAELGLGPRWALGIYATFLLFAYIALLFIYRVAVTPGKRRGRP